ncbi:MAG: CoA-binding protein [Actinobacteria bacterium HGW-Actinobacteria-2]|nr:MAG: CoA-binding protein [Actinobacteria bacterium HGW-Actinobacteria-2]
MKIAQAAEEFLAHRRIAVTGVSRDAGSHGSNTVFDRLVERGYEVFAINPNTETIGEHKAYPDLASVPGGVEAVVIGTSPIHAMATMQQAVELGITSVWMHRSVDAGSVDAAATAYGREHGVTVIDGGCPLMFGRAADGGHKFMCAILKLTGAVPRTV